MTWEDRLEKKTRLDQDAQLLTFRLDDQEYALHIADVVQVVRMVAITPAPKAPEIVEGMINLRGKVIPVIDLRKRFDLLLKPYGLNNHLLIAQTDGRVMALIVDVVNEMQSVPASSLDFSSEPHHPRYHDARDEWLPGHASPETQYGHRQDTRAHALHQG